MKALVIGGGGFLGRWIVRQLLDRGDSVRVLGRRKYPDLEAQGVETVQADVKDRRGVEAACANVDAVFHAASKIAMWGRRRDFYQTNVVGTENVLHACRIHQVRRLVYTSTASVVYGREPIEGEDESCPYPSKHLAVYPETKAAAERMVIEANGKHGMLTCSLRPHLIWGPGDTNLIPRLVERSTSGRLVRIGEGTNRIGVTYVENAADAHLLACDRLVEGSPAPGQCYFLNEPAPVNGWDFIGQLLEGLGCPPVEKSISLRSAYRIGTAFEISYGLLRITREPPMTRFLALQLGTSHWFSISKARRELGWEPQVSLEEGMRRLFEDFRDRT